MAVPTMFYPYLFGYWRTVNGRPYNVLSVFVLGCRGCQSLQIQSTAHCSLLMVFKDEQPFQIK